MVISILLQQKNRGWQMTMQPMHLSPGGASKQSIRRGEEESGILAGRGVVFAVKMFLQIFYVFQ